MSDSKKKFYISTPIYYPSASPHLGHAYCTTMCDVIARGKRLRGYDVFFVTGLDEHGQNIEKNAEAKGVTPQAFVDEVAKTFTSLWNAMEISNDDFIRTTEERHVSTVQKIFSRMLKQDDIYLSSYTGWYCVHEETFWTETQVEVAEGEHLCPECHRPVEKASEDAYFYRCTKYSDFLTDFFDTHPSFITPESRKNEMINTCIKPGLQDLCVSRTSFTWGVPVLEDPKHVVYVWLDALTKCSASRGGLQEDDSKFQEFWQDENTEIVHVIGADITRFHTIYWPMFLHSLALREPNRIFVHGLLMMKDGKMSKSKGNAISAYPLIERYGVDAVRYYLVSEVPFGENGIFTPEQFVMRINQDLANNLGNLLNRTVSMIGKYFQGVVPAFEKNVNPTDKELEDLTALTITRYETLVDDLKVTEAYAEIMNLVSRANKYIEENAPWALAKDETKEKELRSVMAHLAHVLFVAGMLLKPILVHKSDAIFDQLGLGNDERHYDLVSDAHLLDGKVVHKGEQLFPRLDAEKEIEAIKVMMAAPKEKAAA